MWTYNQFDVYLGNKESRPVPSDFGSPRSTTVDRLNNGDIAIYYHYTNVVTLHSDDTFTIKTGGYKTNTTKKRINDFSPVNVFQKDFEWFLADNVPFIDGVRVNVRGNIIPQKAKVNFADSVSDIPNAPYYVLCNDSFMSGWGYASGKINTIILVCADYNEAKKVAAYTESRNDQKYVRIVSNKPRLNNATHYYSLHDRYSYPNWYK